MWAVGKCGLPSLGKVTAATRTALPIPSSQSVCVCMRVRVRACVHSISEYPDNGMAASIWDF